MRTVLLFALLVPVFSNAVTTTTRCGKHEKYTDCGTACPRTCQNKDDPPRPCSKICVRGCFCEDGYIRDESSGKCVTEDRCPKDQCGPHEKYTDCGSACPKTCQNRNDPPKPCIDICVEGCFCEDGFLRNNSTGKCVPEDECPDEVKCGENEEGVECENPCQPTCQDPNRRPCPTFACIKGCHCKPGFLRNSSGCCIPREECPNQCGPHEKYTDCGSACPKTCQNRNDPPKPCIDICVEEPQCSRHEIYTECGSYCPPTCQNQNPGPCIELCKPGCFCKKTYIRDDLTGRCVKESQCP